MKLSALVFVLALISFSSAASFLENYLFSEEFISHINSKTSTWTAGRNFHPETSTNYIKSLCGVHPDHKKYLPPKKAKLVGIEELPKGIYVFTLCVKVARSSKNLLNYFFEI